MVSTKSMLEARDEGYGDGQRNILSHDRWILIVERPGYYHAEARLKKDITLVLERMMGGIWFADARMKAPGETYFRSYEEVFGEVPGRRSVEEMDREAAGKLKLAREEAGWSAADRKAGYKDPSIGEVTLKAGSITSGVGKKIADMGKNTALVPIVILGVCVLVLWYFTLGTVRRA